MSDQQLTCVDCGKPFTFTDGEQDFYASRGFSTPGRCPDCRAARKAARDNGGARGGTYTGGAYVSGERQMYAAVCAQCGKQTEVPFQPSGDRPVYCSDCYRTQGGGSGRGGGYGRSGGSGSGYGRSGGSGYGRSRDRRRY